MLWNQPNIIFCIVTLFIKDTVETTGGWVSPPPAHWSINVTKSEVTMTHCHKKHWHCVVKHAKKYSLLENYLKTLFVIGYCGHHWWLDVPSCPTDQSLMPYNRIHCCTTPLLLHCSALEPNDKVLSAICPLHKTAQGNTKQQKTAENCTKQHKTAQNSAAW